MLEEMIIVEKQANILSIPEEVDDYMKEDPILKDPNGIEELHFRTHDDIDITEYERFVKNAVSRFHSSKAYSNYKAFLFSIGLNRSQFLGNITADMGDKIIEMHHNMLTIFDIAFIICEHVLRSKGSITTFELVKLLKKEHRENHVMLVMLDVTSHQKLEASKHLDDEDKQIFIHPKMCFGDWVTFLDRYYLGITQDIARKIIRYLDKAIKMDDSYDAGLINLRNSIADWSDKYAN